MEEATHNVGSVARLFRNSIRAHCVNINISHGIVRNKSDAGLESLDGDRFQLTRGMKSSEILRVAPSSYNLANGHKPSLTSVAAV